MVVTRGGSPYGGVRGGAPGMRQHEEHLIRRSAQTVQDRPLLSVRRADIPQLSVRGWCYPPSWQQYWQQLWRNGTDARPSAFQAGHFPNWVGVLVEKLLDRDHDLYSLIIFRRRGGWP